ncbi:MAG TPA: hypothetical protein VGF99_12335, partial [Myxococcota bacterium]
MSASSAERSIEDVIADVVTRVIGNADVAEVDRIAALLTLVQRPGLGRSDVLAAALIACLNEPLFSLRAYARAILLRLTNATDDRGEHLHAGAGDDDGTADEVDVAAIAADIRHHRLLRCPHRRGDRVVAAEDADTGRSHCPDCDAVVVESPAFLAALRAEVPEVALFRGPELPTLPWWQVAGQRVQRWGEQTISVGGGDDDHVRIAALPPRALTLVPGDGCFDVVATGGLVVTVGSSLWGSVLPLPVLATTRAQAPALATLHVLRDAEVVADVEVDRADALGLDVVWRGFNVRGRLRVGERRGVSFDGRLELFRSVDGLLVFVDDGRGTVGGHA